MQSKRLWFTAPTGTSPAKKKSIITGPWGLILALILTAPVPAVAASKPSTQASTRPATQPAKRKSTKGPIKTSPALRLQPKRQYKLLYKQFYRVQQTAFGKDTKVRREHNFTLGIKQHKVAQDGTLTLQVTFQRLELRVQAGLLRTYFDSARKRTKTPAQAHILAAFVGHSMLVELKPKGYVKRVTFSQALQQSMQKAITSHPILAMLSGAPRAAMVQQATQQYGPKQWRREMASLWSYLPTTPSTHKWKRRTTSPLYGLQQHTSWLLTRATQHKLFAQRKGTLRQPKDGVTPFDVGVTQHMKYKIKGTTKGTLTIDAKTHLPRTGRLFSEISGHIAWHPTNQTKARRTWPVLIQHITQYKLLP